MKNVKLASAAVLLLTLFVVNACKKDDSSTTTSTTTASKTSVTLNNKVYTSIAGQIQLDSTSNSCNVMCMAVNGTDSLIFMTVFPSLNPAAGSYNLDTLGANPMVAVLPSTFFGNTKESLSGKCNLTKSASLYNVTFTNVDLIDSNTVHSSLSGGYNATF